MATTLPPLAEKIALVTGGSGNIGAAVSRHLAALGASVLVHYASNDESATAVVREIARAGGAAQVARAELALHAGPQDVIDQIDGAFGGRFAGRLDVLVNNAGVFDFGTLTEATDESFDFVVSVVTQPRAACPERCSVLLGAATPPVRE